MTLINKLTTFLNVDVKDTTYFTHGIHSYPAKYIPELPREIILQNTKERNLVLDPFCGSGTTLLEASIYGRKSIGIDSNPIATLISKAKTTALKQDEINKLGDIINEINSTDYSNIYMCEVPEHPNLKHWFKPNVIKELSWIKSYIMNNTQENLQTFLLCIFSSIIVNVSNQESNTRYAAIDKNISDGDTISKFLSKLNSEIPNIVELSSNNKFIKNQPTIYNVSTELVGSDNIPDNSIDIIITSPPYANSYDYYLYHKWRMIWLGYDVKEVQKNEIGSRHEHSSKKEPIEVYEQKMIPVMINLSRMIKPNKLAYFFIGDSIISGEFIDMSECFKRIAEYSNFRFVEGSKYDMDSISRYFYEKKTSLNKNKFTKYQHVLVFEPIKSKSSMLVDKKVIAKAKSKYKAIVLENETPEDKSIVSIVSDEKASPIHGLGKYPAKFIPEIPRWAIKQYSNEGDIVLDPFNGSGTTSTEAILNGRNVIGIDISPYACLLAYSKSRMIDPKLIQKNFGLFLNLLSNIKITNNTLRKKFDNDLFWFNENNLKEIEEIRKIIYNNFEQPFLNILLSIVSTIIKQCSYLDESQIKVKRDSKKLLKELPSPIKLVIKQIKKYEKIFCDFSMQTNAVVKDNIINESSLKLNQYIQNETIDLIITSPPYINAMNYPMNHRYESFLLDLVNPNDSILHQQMYVGTERVYSKDYKKLHLFEEDTLLGELLNNKLKKIYEGEPKRSYITYKYFLEMKLIFEQAVISLKDGGRFVIVAGTNKIKGEYIDTFTILVKILENIGLKYELSYHYEIIKNALKIARHATSDIIKYDGVAVLRKG